MISRDDLKYANILKLGTALSYMYMWLNVFTVDLNGMIASMLCKQGDICM